MGFISGILQPAMGYRCWQLLFAAPKMKPFLRHNEITPSTRILDIGCGPGTHAHHFADAQYLGLDLNESYVQSARRRCPGRFEVADACAWQPGTSERFDDVLVNSFLHHVDDANTRSILAAAAGALADDGHVHVIDMVLPPRRGLSRMLARMDRGAHPRPRAELVALLEEQFEPVVNEPFPLRRLGMTLWHMHYFKGRVRSG